MGKLTTHVLDTANGKAAAGIRIELFLVEGANLKLLKTVESNRDGRTDAPLAEGEGFRAGTYQLVFHIGDYFKAQGQGASFLDAVPVRFGIADPGQHFHVPLLCSPGGYTTYRGT